LDTRRIADALHERFHQDGHRLVFWHDPARAFEDVVGELALDGVSLLRLDEHPALAVKVRLEQEDPTGRYLLYAPFDPPAPDQDWLLDMRLYSASFSADRASMLLAELGFTQQSLRQHLAERARFFASAAPPAWSPPTSTSGSSGTCWRGWSPSSRTTTTAASWGRGAPARATSTRRSARTAS
jgi:hypothetical protein